MSNQNTRAEKLKVLFATHPKTDLFYMTSDDVAFFEQHRADAYAQRLKDKKVTPCQRSVPQAIENLEEGKADTTAESEEDKDILMEKYEELIGSKAPANIKLDTLKKRVAEAEAEAEKEN
ncbi:hypothetical protein [Cyclobacterium marinum]|uniref:Uncharacterized protein n=1 Tax=Cyclobacterium marinum (strain ATCC 25205 / DSM 745 / LMG 13164 / NCIMB 1802) TaxID=880070 RepID=G0IZ69_CYCMS|nr:hypothetical protein [Cyclobacterium marinum]AEL23848.1 hypothetical protein Cycma_0063 [Cyclobacterium marinum DSM 745]